MKFGACLKTVSTPGLRISFRALIVEAITYAIF